MKVHILIAVLFSISASAQEAERFTLDLSCRFGDLYADEPGGGQHTNLSLAPYPVDRSAAFAVSEGKVEVAGEHSYKDLAGKTFIKLSAFIGKPGLLSVWFLRYAADGSLAEGPGMLMRSDGFYYYDVNAEIFIKCIRTNDPTTLEDELIDL